MNDIKNEDFADFLCFLAPWPEVTKKLVKSGGKYYKSQKAHMVMWFLSQDETGSGAYMRDHANTSARTTYNRLQNIDSLVWLADAFGEDSETVTSAFSDADAGTNQRAKCSAFRRHIPFDRILELFCNPDLWRIDPALLPFLKKEETGFPYLPREYEEITNKIFDEEFG